MKIYSITVDAMPKSCGSCPLCGYINSDFPVCYGVADKQIWRLVGKYKQRPAVNKNAAQRV